MPTDMSTLQDHRRDEMLHSTISTMRYLKSRLEQESTKLERTVQSITDSILHSKADIDDKRSALGRLLKLLPEDSTAAASLANTIGFYTQDETSNPV